MSVAACKAITLHVADALSILLPDTIRTGFQPLTAQHNGNIKFWLCCKHVYRPVFLTLALARPHAFGTEFVPYLPAEYNQYVCHHIHSQFVAATVDELSKIYVHVYRRIVCLFAGSTSYNSFWRM
jgi:hypothetical protein